MGAIGDLLPLVILFAFVGTFAWMGYQMYIYTNELADRGVKHLEKKNIVYTKDGLRVGVKQKREEDTEDAAQSMLVKAWNLASFPGYKSKLWNTEATPNFQRTPSGSKLSPSGASSGARPTASRSGSHLSERSMK